MRKLSLKFEELKIESFESVKHDEARGTVAANATGRNCHPDTVEDYTCGIWCPPTTDPQNTGPCAC
jgi:hypothetical protein